MEVEPPLPGALADLLERAAARRPEVGLAREAVAAAEQGRQAARGEFLPRIFVRAVAGHTDGQNIITGWQEGAGLHLETPFYAGGRHLGDLRAADAEIAGAVADAQVILDAISLQVNLAYRGVVAARERIALARTAVVQAQENLRLLRVRYRNGYLTRTGGKYAYAGLRMGLVLPMVVVAPRAEFGSLTPAVQRLEGILLGLAVSIVVAGLWPRFPLADRPAPAAAPDFPGEMEV